jgi:multimeric flavodoxin WrbA
MKRVLIVYHSMTGGTVQMAHAAAAGARAEEGVVVNLMRCADAQSDDVLRADGFIFATPENLAGVSGMMKDFFDRTYYAVLEKINGRPFLSLICAGSDGRNAAQQIDRITAGWRLKRIAETYIVCTQAQTPEAILAPKKITEAALLRCEELGRTLAGGMTMGVF